MSPMTHKHNDFVYRSEPFKGHEIEHRFYSTERQTRLQPHHFNHKRRIDWFHVLLSISILSGCAALVAFLVQVFR